MLRGLLAKQAVRQQHAFAQLCAVSEVLPITDEVVEQSAVIYADLHQRGELIGDADILISATALVYGYALATNNTDHFSRIAGLAIENWLLAG